MRTPPDEITVTVLQDDIDNGRRGRAHSCPIALAVNRDNPSAQEVSVTGKIRIDSAVYQNPDEAIEFIRAFDTGRPVVPFKFTAKRCFNAYA